MPAELPDGEELESQERGLFTFSHAEFSAAATLHWHLPEKAQTAVRFHERPIREETAHGLEEVTLSDVLHAADRCATGYGMSVLDAPSKDGAVAETLARLRVKESEIAAEFLRQLAAFDECDRRTKGINLASRLTG